MISSGLQGVPESTHVSAMVGMLKTNPIGILIVPFISADGDSDRFSWAGKYNMRAKGVGVDGDGIELMKILLAQALWDLDNLDMSEELGYD
jgi:hypothetical protein